MARRCVVQGCNSADAEKQFRSTIMRHGQAWCPRHSCQSDKCGCSASSKLFSYFNFPKSPGLRRVWNALLEMPEDYNPSRHYSVCSKHFDVESGGSGAQRRKVPMLNICRPESEIQQILRSHVSSVVEKQAILGMSVPSSKVANARLADTTATTVIAALEYCVKNTRGDSSVVDENRGRTMTYSCCVVGCGSKAMSSYDWPYPFFRLPDNPELARRWTDVITGSRWKLIPEARVCAKHFVDGRPTAEHPCPELEIPAIRQLNAEGNCRLIVENCQSTTSKTATSTHDYYISSGPSAAVDAPQMESMNPKSPCADFPATIPPAAGASSSITQPREFPTAIPIENEANVDSSLDLRQTTDDPSTRALIKRHKARKVIMTIPSKKPRLQATEYPDPDMQPSNPSVVSDASASSAQHFTTPNTSNNNERTSPHLPPKCNVCGDEGLAELRRELRRVEAKVDSIYELLRTTLRAGDRVTSPPTACESSPTGRILPRWTLAGQSSLPPQTTTTTTTPRIDFADNTTSASTTTKTVAAAGAGITISIRRDDDENSQDAKPPIQRTTPPAATLPSCDSAISAVEIKEELQEEDEESPAAFIDMGHNSNGDTPLSSCGLEDSIIKPVARAILLFTGWAVTMEHLMEYGPTWINRVSEDEVRKVIDHLVRDNLLKELGRHDVRWPTSTSETTRNMVIYSKLMPAVGDHRVEKYGLTTRAYQDALRYKVTQCTAHLNEICDMVSGTIGRSKTTRLSC